MCHSLPTSAYMIKTRNFHMPSRLQLLPCGPSFSNHCKPHVLMSTSPHRHRIARREGHHWSIWNFSQEGSWKLIYLERYGRSGHSLRWIDWWCVFFHMKGPCYWLPGPSDWWMKIPCWLPKEHGDKLLLVYIVVYLGPFSRNKNHRAYYCSKFFFCCSGYTSNKSV